MGCTSVAIVRWEPASGVDECTLNRLHCVVAGEVNREWTIKVADGIELLRELRVYASCVLAAQQHWTSWMSTISSGTRKLHL